jgi:hypothetical protein
MMAPMANKKTSFQTVHLLAYRFRKLDEGFRRTHLLTEWAG